LARLRDVLSGFDSVGEIRGVGLMIGIELVADKATKRGFSRPHSACARVEAEAWERGLYVRAMGTEVVGLAPPAHIGRACADAIVAILAESIAAMEADVLASERERAARLAARRADSIDDLFAKMAGHFDAAKADGVDLVVQYALSGEGGGTWIVAVRGGQLTVERAEAERADAGATLRADAASYLRIANGELSGAEAFSTRRLAIGGDPALFARLAELGLV